LSDPLTVDPEPGGGFNVRAMAPTLIVDVIMPMITFYLLYGLGASTLVALVAGGLFPAANIIRVWIKSRNLEPLAFIVVTFLAIGTATSLISRSVFFALIKDSLVSATFASLCLGSLLAERPLMFHLLRQFVAGDDPQRRDWWKGLWQYPQFRTALRRVTTVWGIAYLLEASTRICLALLLAPVIVVTISPAMGIGMLVALIAWTKHYMLALRSRGIGAQQQGQPA
jgi:intracellular septation protein A